MISKIKCNKVFPRRVNILTTFTLCKANGMIHVQRSFREIARALNKFWLVESWFLDTRSIGSRYIAQWTIFDQSESRIQSPSVWLVENCSTVRCICCRWTLYPKINFQPIRTCLTHVQFRGMTVGHVSFRWTCIVLHSAQICPLYHKNHFFFYFQRSVPRLPLHSLKLGLCFIYSWNTSPHFNIASATVHLVLHGSYSIQFQAISDTLSIVDWKIFANAPKATCCLALLVLKISHIYC